MRFQPRVATDVRRWTTAGYVCAVALALLLLVVASGDAALVGHDGPQTGVVEMIYVKGCAADSAPLRSTAGCFTAGQSAEHITVRGVNFPHNEDGTSPDLHVVFEESRLPSIFEDEPGYAKSASATAMEKTVQLACTPVTPSSLFPSQLLTCTLPRPSLETLAAGDDTAPASFLARARQYPVWMDARLVAEGRPIGVLRRALEVDLRSTAKRATATAQYEADVSGPSGVPPAESRGDEGGLPAASLEALERLYTPSSTATPSASSDGSEDGAPTAASEDVWRNELGVGGLKDELQLLYRRVFLSRLPSLMPITEALGLQHVRGVILYGPPGNGKTLVARGLVRLLGPDTRMTVVNAGDVLSKYVGESEKNLRDLFEGRQLGSTARQEDEDMDHNVHRPRDAPVDGDSTAAAPAPLHVLVIDEFDALFRRRGHSDDESSAKAVFDGVTNALLSLMDGVKTRNDILVVGLTNRLDAVDEALLRPGRFEVLIEVPAPDQPAREEIFFIHTEKLRQRAFLGDGIDLAQLGAQTAGFSGSDIAGVVRAATSRALLRHRQATARGDVAPEAFQVTADEFQRAVKEVRETKRDAGTESASTWADTRSDLVDHDGTLARHTASVVNLTRRLALASRAATTLPWLRSLSGESATAFAATVAISGPAGSGKTAVARHLVQHLPDVAGVQFLSGKRLVEAPDVEASLAAIQQVFNSAAKAGGLNAVVIDDADVLVERLRGNERALRRLQGMTHTFLRSRVTQAAAAHQPGAAQRHADLHVTPEPTAQEAALKLSNTRLLILTVTKQSVLRDLSVDLHIRTHPITRSGVRRALAHLHIVGDARSPFAVALSEVYPVSLSFDEFLRVTQLALQSGAFSAIAPQAPSEATREQAAATDASMAEPADAASDAPVLVKDDGVAAQYMVAVRDVISAMGLYDPFQAWYNPAGQKVTHTPEEMIAKAKNHELEESDSDGSELLW